MPMSNFYQELTRRRLLQTAALYIAVAWGGTEILAFLTDALLGEAAAVNARRYLATLLIAGFPAAMYLAWTRDMGLMARRFFSAGVLVVLFVGVLITTIPEPVPDGLPPVAENSIAILPFDVCEGRSSDLQLAGGLTGEVTNRLAQRDRLDVKGRRSVEMVAKAVGSLTDIAAHLGVETVLNGTLCRNGVDLKLQAELSDNRGFIVWEDEFHQVVNRFDQVEEQLATLVENGVAAALGDVVTTSHGAAVHRSALEQFLIGREFRRQENIAEARSAFEQALAIQPDYAEAVLELAWLEWDEGGPDTFGDDLREVFPIAEEALGLAQQHLQRDPHSYDANRVAGRVFRSLSYLEEEIAYRDFHDIGPEGVAERLARSQEYLAAAERHYRAVLAANPTDTDIRLQLTSCIDKQGAERRKESLEILQQGLEVEPFHTELADRIAFRLNEFGRLNEAMEQLDRFEVLPQGKAGLWWTQSEILQDLGRYDQKLAYHIEHLKAGPESPDMNMPMHFFWNVAGVAQLGLYEEASSLYDIVAPIPGGDEPFIGGRTARQFFLDDKYRNAIGWGDQAAEEFDRDVLARVEGKNNDEILKFYSLEASQIAGTLWDTGERSRAIALIEAIRHSRTGPTSWAQRQLWQSELLVAWYMEEGRVDDAVPVLNEMIDFLQAEVDAGVRHPQILMRLASAYGWLGENDKALDLLDRAIDYGAYDMSMCCLDLVPKLPRYYEVQWWDGLVDDPRFELAQSRMRAIVEQQRSNIRALLAQNDLEALVAQLVERWAPYAQD
jgi:tetratricopeptide (TPR) repeat protein